MLFVNKFFTSDSSRIHATIICALFLTVCAVTTSANAATPGDLYDELTDDQKRMADRMLSFMEETESKFFDIAQRFNGNADHETKDIEHEGSNINIKVVRGDVIEKGAITQNFTKTPFLPFLPSEPVWNRFLEIDIHPRTPLVGVLHISAIFRYEKDGSKSLGGVMQIAPGARIEEDFDYMREKVDAVFDKFGVDVTPFRDSNCSGHRHELIPLACSGVSFHVKEPLSISDTNFDHLTETYNALLDAYMDVLEKRQDQPYTDEDLAAQDKMRRGWFEDHLFSDPFTAQFMPYESWTFMHAPPTLKY